MSCHVMSCHVMSCHVMSCHVMSCPFNKFPRVLEIVIACIYIYMCVFNCHHSHQNCRFEVSAVSRVLGQFLGIPSNAAP